MAVVKLFSDPAVAVSAIRELQSRGIQASDIGVAVKSGDASNVISRRGEMALTAKVEAAGIGTVALAGPAAAGNSLDSLAEIWGVAKEVLFYYEGGLRRGGVVISVHVDAAKTEQAKAALRYVDAFRIVPTNPESNDDTFYRAERATKSDERDKAFSGEFRKY